MRRLRTSDQRLEQTPDRLVKLADAAFRRRGRVVLAWIVALAAVGALGGGLAGEFDGGYTTPGSDSAAASVLIEERFPRIGSGDTIDVVWQVDAGRSAEGPPRAVDRFLAEARGLEGVVRVGEVAVAPGGDVAMAPLHLDRPSPEVPVTTAERLLERAAALERGGLRIELGGAAIDQAEESTSPELAALLAAAVILLLAFRSLVAAGLPIVVALFGLGISASLIGVLAGVAVVPEWAMAVAALIGIGVGIDYSLLIVSRYRSARAAGRSSREANAEAIATAGRSVLLAGGTVVVALLGLFVVGIPFLNGVALSAGLAVLVVLGAAVTLLPALLAYLGPHLERARLPRLRRARRAEDETARRWSRAVQRRPWRSGLAALAVLVLLSLPALDLRLGFPDAGNDPAGSSTRAAYDLIADSFGAGHNGPLLLAADLRGQGDAGHVPAVRDRVAATPGVASVSEPVFNPDRDAALLVATPTASPQDADTERLVTRLRDDAIPAAAADAASDWHVGGTTAALIDQSSLVGDRLALFIAAVVGLAFVLLLAVLRAPVLALTGAAMNVISVAAAYGVLALVASGGWLGGLVGIDTATPVPAAILVMMFAILFGLSMDYEVFLLTRMREEFLAGAGPAGAITAGIAHSARVITAAAAIMVAVFLGFVFSSEVFLVMTGVGMAAAILIDATLIRMVLVPATMQVLGRANWWRPATLRATPHPAREGRS